ncbi:MAG TPA: PAAR-like domain-containing protein [Polyangiaceae bacterium]|jgi:hypothetical protein|nr:PAAR-like domain-containing protein [Polyangiaceae bacterium]
MFATTQIPSLALAFPDVCKVPVLGVPVPVPFPNIALSVTSVPIVLNVIVGGGPVHNLMTPGTISMGDELGVLLGLVSNLEIGPPTYVLGSFKTFWGTAPAARMTSLTGHNGMPFNMVGMSLSPSQVTVLLVG